MSEIGELGLFEAMRDLESNAGINGNFGLLFLRKFGKERRERADKAGKRGGRWRSYRERQRGRPYFDISVRSSHALSVTLEPF